MRYRALGFGVPLLLLQVFLASYFLDTADGANGISRAIAPVTWVLQGTWSVDAFAHFTQDVCTIDGHAYSDKAPLSSWVVVPFVWLGHVLGLGFRKLNLRSVQQAVMVGNVLTGSLPFAGVLLLLARRMHGVIPRVNPIVLATLTMYGTFLWAYAGSYFGHMMAAFFVLSASITRRNGQPFWAGILLGLALLTEYPTAVALPIWCAQSWLIGDGRATKRLVLGFVPALAVLAVYNMTLTHSPFTLTYKYTAAKEFAAMHTHYGFSWPSPKVLYELTLGTRRGLIVFAPALMWAAVLTFVRHGRAVVHKAVMHPEVSVGLALLCINASYFVWSGGESFGPRHLVVASTLWAYAALPVLMTAQYPRIPFYMMLATLTLVWADKATRTHVIQPTQAPWRAVWPDLSIFYFNDNALPTLFDLTTAVVGAELWLPVLWGGTWASCKLYNYSRRT